MNTIPYVFLGGATTSDWRSNFTVMLKPSVTYFNPIVPDWNEEAYQKELVMRKECPYVVYVLSPTQVGNYSVAEVVDDSNKRPDRTLLCVLFTDTDINGKVVTSTEGQIKSNQAIAKMVRENGARVFYSLKDMADYLNESID